MQLCAEPATLTQQEINYAVVQPRSTWSPDGPPPDNALRFPNTEAAPGIQQYAAFVDLEPRLTHTPAIPPPAGTLVLYSQVQFSQENN